MALRQLAALLFIFALSVCDAGRNQGCDHCKCLDDEEFGGLKVVCSNLSLTSVPDNINITATTLLLDGNKLTNLPENTFKYLSRLQFLDVSFNQLKQINENAFRGLERLQVLNLTGNVLKLSSETFKPNVFKPLKRLLQLWISENIVPNNATYPDESFSHLTALEELHIDGLPCDFGPGFAKLSHLTNLSLSGNSKSELSNCNIPVLRNTTFGNVPTVQNIDLRFCQIKSIELSTFATLKLIRFIDISDNRNLGFPGLANASYGLRNSFIEVLKVNRIYPENDVCTHLKHKHVVYLKTTKLKELHMDENGIIGAEPAAIELIANSVEIVSARYNKFQIGSYIFATIGAKSLKLADFSGINKIRPLPFLKRSAGSLFGRNGSFIPIPVPPNLETLIVSDCAFPGKITAGGIQRPNSLKTLIASKNYLSALHGPISGYEKLEHLDLSSNIIQEIGRNYFQEMISITYLNLANNFLGRALSKDKEGDTFHFLNKTRTINLSQNRITQLTKKVFAGLLNVENIDLSGNYLTSFDVSMSNRPKKSLNLTGNKIQILSSSALVELGKFTKVLLENNPISCSCMGLEFLKWMKANEFRISDIKAITCQLSPGKDMSFTHLDFIITKLNSECVSANILAISISLSLFLFVLGVICVSVGYRQRWKLRYMYHVGRKRYRRQIVDNGDDETYQYDVFVSYAAPDRRFVIDAMMPELETKAGLRMCIHDRDFVPGEVIATNIVNAIQNSRATLCLLSPSFLKSDWCEFEYHMARLESVTRRQNTVLVVLYKPVKLEDLPKDMTIMFRNNCYLQYNEEEFGDAVFWERVTEAIKSNRLPE